MGEELMDLNELLKLATTYRMTPEQVREQHLSFVYGMLPSNSTLTKEEVRRLMEEHGL